MSNVVNLQVGELIIMVIGAAALYWLFSVVGAFGKNWVAKKNLEKNGVDRRNGNGEYGKLQQKVSENQHKISAIFDKFVPRIESNTRDIAVMTKGLESIEQKIDRCDSKLDQILRQGKNQ